MFNNVLLACCVLILTAFSFPVMAATLEEGFKEPPREYSQVPLWSLNGTLDPERMSWQVDQMVDKGVYGAFMHARDGLDQSNTPYFSDGWWKAIEATVEHASQVGFKTWIYDEDKWPSGSAGGRTIKANPERNRLKGLAPTELRFEGPSRQVIDIPAARYVLAGQLTDDNTLNPKSIVDVSAFNKGTHSDARAWKCPKGNWLVIGYTLKETTVDGQPNIMNKDTVRDFINITHEEYAKRVGSHFGTTIPGVFFDEISNRGIPIVWVEGFEERFKKLKGYDIVRYLPALTFDIGPETPRIRCDYYDVYADLYENAWFKQIADWCDAHKIALTGHTNEAFKNYRDEADYFRTMSHLQIPMTDNEDFRYTWPREIGIFKPKQIASLCHVYGRPRVAVEAMGGPGWSFTLDSARYGFNMLAAYGINLYYPHLFHYAQDTPTNVDDWPASWFFQNPFWKYYKTFANHGSRLSYMLTGGKHVVDVAILYPQESLWAYGNPGMAEQALTMLINDHIDADLIDPDSLLRANVGEGVVAVSDMRYKVLILPALQCIRRSTARQIEAFARNGGRVIVVNRWPKDSMETGKDDKELAELQKALEKEGVADINIKELSARIEKSIDRDVTVSGTGAKELRYQHVLREGKEIYWVANSVSTPADCEIRFRATGAASLWQPEDGSITPLPLTAQDKGGSTCSLALDGWQGVFVVFDPSQQPRVASTQEVAAAKPKRTELMNLTDRPWTFLAAGAALDDDWRVDLKESALELPVMNVCWERADDGSRKNWATAEYDDCHWRRVKVLDTLHPEKGSDRYRTNWRGRFISYYLYTPKLATTVGGKNLTCKKILDLPGVKSGSLAVVTDSSFKVMVNEQEVGHGDGGREVQQISLPAMNGGKITLSIIAKKATAILAEGQLQLVDGSTQDIFTDATWIAELDGKEQAAWEYVAPPEPPYGNPACPWAQEQPDVVWYRQALPAGVAVIETPLIEGKWDAWTDGKTIRFDNGVAKIAPGAKLLALRVVLGEGDHGLMKPIRVKCRPAVQPLGSWTNYALDWYSGRSVYSTDFTLNQIPSDKKVEIDLGKVSYCAEIWINGKLVGTRIWPPYRMDITQCVKQGKNKVDVIVANLLANRMHWDIYDDVRAEETNRKWHDGNLLRDIWCFDSGLSGPVKLETVP